MNQNTNNEIGNPNSDNSTEQQPASFLYFKQPFDAPPPEE